MNDVRFTITGEIAYDKKVWKPAITDGVMTGLIREDGTTAHIVLALEEKNEDTGARRELDPFAYDTGLVFDGDSDIVMEELPGW